MTETGSSSPVADGAAPVIARPAARIVLIDDRDRVLLFRWLNPFWGKERTTAQSALEVPGLATNESWWITPGGGLHAGETHEECAIRELWEETGLAGATLGPCIWTRNYVFRGRERSVEQQERYFLARVNRFEASRENFEEYEKTALSEARWWSVDELQASDELFVPGALATLLVPLLAGELPSKPLYVG